MCSGTRSRCTSSRSAGRPRPRSRAGGHPGAQLVDRRVLALLLVADLGRRHRLPHRGRRPRLGVRVEVDHSASGAARGRSARPCRGPCAAGAGASRAAAPASRSAPSRSAHLLDRPDDPPVGRRGEPGVDVALRLARAWASAAPSRAARSRSSPTRKPRHQRERDRLAPRLLARARRPPPCARAPARPWRRRVVLVRPARGQRGAARPAPPPMISGGCGCCTGRGCASRPSSV